MTPDKLVTLEWSDRAHGPVVRLHLLGASAPIELAPDEARTLARELAAVLAATEARRALVPERPRRGTR